MNDLYNQESGVLELKKKDFKVNKKKKIYTVTHKIFKNKQGLIIFYRPECIHCVNIVDTWSYISILFNNKFIMSAVNTQNYKQNLNIEDYLNIPFRYPTIRYVNSKGHLKKYNGKLDRNSILSFICTKI